MRKTFVSVCFAQKKSDSDAIIYNETTQRVIIEYKNIVRSIVCRFDLLDIQNDILNTAFVYIVKIISFR